MSKLVVVMFPDAAMIQEAIDALKKLRAERHIKLYASTAVARDPNGKLSIQEVTKEGLGGAAVGAFIGALAGLPVMAKWFNVPIGKTPSGVSVPASLPATALTVPSPPPATIG